LAQILHYSPSEEFHFFKHLSILTDLQNISHKTVNKKSRFSKVMNS
jgi:hypothetical protein